jgi:hypothetical protein
MKMKEDEEGRGGRKRRKEEEEGRGGKRMEKEDGGKDDGNEDGKKTVGPFSEKTNATCVKNQGISIIGPSV